MGTVRVLLADDHAVVRSGIRNAIEDLPDLQVVGEVGDGPSLGPALVSLHPDLLVIDVTMPHFEPVGMIRDVHLQYPALKILVVTAYDDDAYVQGLLGVGVNGYHLKDQPLSDLPARGTARPCRRTVDFQQFDQQAPQLFRVSHAFDDAHRPAAGYFGFA